LVGVTRNKWSNSQSDSVVLQSYSPDLAPSGFHLFGPPNQNFEEADCKVIKWRWLRMQQPDFTGTASLNSCQNGTHASIYSGIMLKNIDTSVEQTNYIKRCNDFSFNCNVLGSRAYCTTPVLICLPLANPSYDEDSTAQDIPRQHVRVCQNGNYRNKETQRGIWDKLCKTHKM
jgi:hypothetical protein